MLPPPPSSDSCSIVCLGMVAVTRNILDTFVHLIRLAPSRFLFENGRYFFVTWVAGVQKPVRRGRRHQARINQRGVYVTRCGVYVILFQ